MGSGMTMKFKVGDVIKIICADKETSTPTTIRMIGKVGTIVKFSGLNNIPYTISLPFEDSNIKLNFMEKEIALNIKIGEQLLLFEL